VLDAQGRVLYVNAALENALGLSRRMLLGADFAALFGDPATVQTALAAVRAQDYAQMRCEAALRRPQQEPLPVHAHIAPAEHAGEQVVELWPLLAQAHQDREERLLEQAQANKELIRNLAHEIKNPLGGIRGAAQLLQLELASPELAEYTQVIIHEADRLQHLVDRLLAPHRQPRLVGDVNIHEVCEHVCRLVLAEHPRGLVIQRDYDTSIPEFRGDRAQLGRCADHAAHARGAAGHPGAPAAQAGIGIACHRQRPGRARGHQGAHLLSPGDRPGWRFGPGPAAGAGLCAAPPGHDRLREPAGLHRLSHPHSIAMTSHRNPHA